MKTREVDFERVASTRATSTGTRTASSVGNRLSQRSPLSFELSLDQLPHLFGKLPSIEEPGVYVEALGDSVCN
jgi:hypothetical protein